MDARSVILIAFLCVFLDGVLGQVGSLCRPKERLLLCGCPKSCRDPVPDCKGVCKEGCFCEEGEVRNDKGICVKLADCPPIPAPYKLETSEPRVHGGSCPIDEEYRFCEPCNRTCDNPNPICPAQCATGCFCKGDLLRDKDGKCVKYEKCSNILEYIAEREKNIVASMPYPYSCGANQHYRECQKCTQTCSDPEPVCGKCKTGCVCKEGFVKGPNGKCVKKDECPKVKCLDLNEEYSCLFGCERHCSEGATGHSCQVRRFPLRCVLGCHCRRSLYRDGNKCVQRELCYNNNSTIVVE